MTLTERIQRPTLHEELVERLRALIVQDTLKPGEKVPEKDLCAAFGVSRTPLREALKVLASEGFVILHANRGARVAQVTRKELEDAFALIAVLEQLAGEMACHRIDDATVVRIEERHEEMLKAHAARDRARYFQANQDIHKALILASGNDLLESHHKLLDARVQRARFMVNLSEDRWAQAIEEHGAMMDRLRRRDGEGLGQLMKRHMMNKCSAYLRELDTDTGAGA
ncbi:GntR family transcriptional regulator [Maliponia aquimaris]|uniref:Putative HTH-type transcriptional regulator YdfH n=1 Tax=Maliponia aquimaris TaxID=1673631 RepID=A0A238L7A6_9RHOB|nr:GntR family transcriptional regulator [Maliponia aquimaris]SMX50888.1 putative HTH-type transcriptional regulator YdfH [Maliponia aquimaris]